LRVALRPDDLATPEEKAIDLQYLHLGLVIWLALPYFSLLKSHEPPPGSVTEKFSIIFRLSP
jgi:hypothetical protein